MSDVSSHITKHKSNDPLVTMKRLLNCCIPTCQKNKFLMKMWPASIHILYERTEHLYLSVYVHTDVSFDFSVLLTTKCQ
jgi:hypothetical protein